MAVAVHRMQTRREQPYIPAANVLTCPQIEGVFTIVMGLLFLALFPRAIGNPTSLLGVGYFSERERLILAERIIRDDLSKAQPRQSITWKEIRDTASRPSCCTGARTER